ncbi:hypothetical protein MVEN_01190500 [Mycena venus]|uniref:MYND-type domain-containing protein n=1 Tax=Mycena venus TaxID=2733690 RepID=A0A8H6Y2T8_9AGAR|nr:hypothetical protein MVEN_01190500 [Mycena venus]
MAKKKVNLECKHRAGPSITVWDKWQPACDACGRSESSLAKKQQLLSCSGCLLAKYCSKECQKNDWKSTHKNRCHLFEADRKLSTVFAKSLGPGTINDPNLGIADKVIQWNFLNVHNHMMIACAALKNDRKMAAMANVGIFLRLVEERTGSKYDNRTFIIERVALLPREDSDAFAKESPWRFGNTPATNDYGEHTKLLVGSYLLPNGKESETQLWVIPTAPDDPRFPRFADVVLPPNFDLHRYITHVNRGVTHFHASFWEVPRDISDSDLEAAEPHPAYPSYELHHHLLVSGLKGQDVIGIENPDGNRTPLFKRAMSGHVRKCAPGETDSDGPAEYKKLLADPSRMVKKIAKYLDMMSEFQETVMKQEKKFPPGSEAEF